MNQEIVIVKNAEGDPDTKARVLIKNKIDYTPKVSVIIPVYNTEKYLRECLDSVINQTLKEIEIICVDDGSTDNSLEILKEYAAKDNRITVLAQENLYAGVARNAGMMVASGEYYHFLDSDDWVENDIYKIILNSDKKYDIVVFSNYVIDNATLNISRINKLNIDKINSYNIFMQVSPNAWTKLFNKNFIHINEIKFQHLQVANDLTFTYTALSLADNINYINKPFVYYRSNQTSNLTANRGDKIECYFIAIQKLFNNLKINCIFNKYKEAFYDRAKASLKYELKFYKHSYSELRQIMYKILESELYLKLESYIKPKISIIIPVYNSEKYLRECLDSVINQTLKDIEIICINDGSTDKSLSILREYKEIDNRIKVITQKNQRQGAARNRGLEIAKGEYIQYLDSDDYLDLTACDMLYQKAIANELDMLCFSAYCFNDGIKYENKYYNFTFLPKNFNDIFNISDCKEFCTRFVTSAAFTIYRFDFLQSINLKWEEGLFYEDNIYFVNAFIRAKKVSILNEKLYYRRIHDTSTTGFKNNNFDSKIKSFFILLCSIHNRLEKEMFAKYFYSYTMILLNDYLNFDKQEQKKYFNELRECYINVSKLHSLSNEINTNFGLISINVNEYIKSINCYNRIDIKNNGLKNNKIEIIQIANNSKAISTYKSNGYSFIGNNNIIEFKAIRNGLLVIDLFGIENGITYNQIKLNDENILENSIVLYVNDAYKIKKNVTNNKVYKLEIDYADNKVFKINIRNVKTPKNNIELLNNSSKINVSTPAWFTNDKGIGSVLISQNYKDSFKVKAIGNGNLSFKFMGIDKRFNNEKIPLYVNYQSIKINGKEILDEPITAWHDKAFTYEMKVKDDEIIDVEVIKSPYPYTKNELKDLIIKLSNGVEPKDINNIIKHIIKNRLEYEKSSKTKQPSKIFSITREKYKTIYYLLGLKYVKFNTRREILDLIKEENAKLKKEIEQLKIELKNK